MRLGRGGSFLLLGALGVAAAFVGYTARTAPPLMTGALALALLAAGMTACIPLWRGFDEVSREAHKTAWCHGGQIGLTVAGAVFVWAEVSGGALHMPALDSMSAGSLLAAGIAITFGLQVLGYALFWAGWWISKR